MLTYNGDAIRRRLWTGCLIVLLCLSLPRTMRASSPDPDPVGPEKCAECHPAQAETWAGSTHAHAKVADSGAGVTCEACHGAYVANHPQDGVMKVNADPSSCKDCHPTTYEQWHETAHSGANVQCVGCHVPHSQKTRLVGEELCASCHREEAEHWVHHDADVHCTDCHISSSPPDAAGDVRVLAGGTAPDHRFQLAVEACVGCHKQSIHDKVFHNAAGQIEVSQLSVMSARAGELANQLEDAKKANRSLRTTSVVSLGFGLGTGGVLGVILMLVVGYIIQGRDRK